MTADSLVAAALEVEPAASPVDRLEAENLKRPQVNFPVEHFFAPGHYARKMSIPAGCLATGATHKAEFLTIVVKGHLLLVTDEGTKEVRAGYHGLCKAGIKRAAFTYEDSVLITFHATDETDVTKIEDELVVESDRLMSRKCLTHDAVEALQ